MGLFDQIVGALDNPNQQANSGQFSSILGAVQQLSGGQGLDSTTTQSMLSVVGRHVRSALQQQRSVNGNEQVEALVNQYSGTQPNADAVRSLFTPEQEQATVRDTAQQTGLNSSIIQSLLPMLVPVVLNLLQSGSTTQNARGSNSVLSSFLDSDRDGDVDIGDTLSLANQFFNRPR